MNALTDYVNRYIKIKIRTYGDKVSTNILDLNIQGDDFNNVYRPFPRSMM